MPMGAILAGVARRPVRQQVLLWDGAKPNWGGVTASIISGLTAGQLLFGAADGSVGQSSNVAWDGSTFTVGGAIVGTNLKGTGYTPGRVPYFSTAGLIADSANFTFDGTSKLTVGAHGVVSIISTSALFTETTYATSGDAGLLVSTVGDSYLNGASGRSVFVRINNVPVATFTGLSTAFDSAATFAGSASGGVAMTTGALATTVHLAIGSLTVPPTWVTGVTQQGVTLQICASSAATSELRIIQARPGLVAAAFTCADVNKFYAQLTAVGSGAAVTRTCAFFSRKDNAGASGNVGFLHDATSPTSAAAVGAWGFYNNTADKNYLGTGATLIGTTTDDGINALQVVGSANFTTGATVGGVAVVTTTDARLVTNKIRTYIATGVNGNVAGSDIATFTGLPAKYLVLRLSVFEASTTPGGAALMQLRDTAAGAGTTINQVTPPASMTTPSKVYSDSFVSITYQTTGTLYLYGFSANGAAITFSALVQILDLT
jgi:hypothetical protein